MNLQTIKKRSDYEVNCPFNRNHKMPYSKLLYHISKGCRDKRERGHLFEQCPYNFLHFLRKDLLNEHLLNCKTKLRIQYESSHINQEQWEIEQVIQRQFVDKKVIGVNSDMEAPNIDCNQQLMPSWSMAIDEAQELQNKQLVQPYKSILSQDDEEYQDEEDQSEINMIAMLNYMPSSFVVEKRDIKNTGSQDEDQIKSIEFGMKGFTVKQYSQDNKSILNESQYSSIDQIDYSLMSRQTNKDKSNDKYQLNQEDNQLKNDQYVKYNNDNHDEYNGGNRSNTYLGNDKYYRDSKYDGNDRYDGSHRYNGNYRDYIHNGNDHYDRQSDRNIYNRYDRNEQYTENDDCNRYNKYQRNYNYDRSDAQDGPFNQRFTQQEYPQQHLNNQVNNWDNSQSNKISENKNFGNGYVDKEKIELQIRPLRGYKR